MKKISGGGPPKPKKNADDPHYALECGLRRREEAWREYRSRTPRSVLL